MGGIEAAHEGPHLASGDPLDDLDELRLTRVLKEQTRVAQALVLPISDNDVSARAKVFSSVHRTASLPAYAERALVRPRPNCSL